ncbi:MAG: pilus assembly protein PilM, partial [Dehalococcoidales bacterium]|nr:pilus assembly protein PilM [Dehalococcoidales bacterium]
MAKRITTLFIEDNRINALVMRGTQAEKWASLPLDPGLVSQGLILDEAQVAGKIQELLAREKISTKQVIAGLSGINSVFRIVTMPGLPEAILPEAVKREASRIIPVPIDEVYLAYQIISSSTGEIRIFLAAFPRNMTDNLIKTLRRAGLDPYNVDLAPLALCRIPNEPRSIIVNTSLDYLNIMVMTDRLPQLIRGLSLPGETQSLAEKLPAIAEELTRTITFYNSTHMDKPLDPTVPVLACGELAEAPDAWPSLVGRSGYTVSALASPLEPTEGFKPNDFMVNIGLALKELPPKADRINASIINFNALPATFVPKPFPVGKVVVPIIALVVVGFLAYAALFVRDAGARTEELRAQLTSTQGTIAQTRKEI